MPLHAVTLLVSTYFDLTGTAHVRYVERSEGTDRGHVPNMIGICVRKNTKYSKSSGRERSDFVLAGMVSSGEAAESSSLTKE
jgi:hypothetical protein